MTSRLSKAKQLLIASVDRTTDSKLNMLIKWHHGNTLEAVKELVRGTKPLGGNLSETAVIRNYSALATASSAIIHATIEASDLLQDDALVSHLTHLIQRQLCVCVLDPLFEGSGITSTDIIEAIKAEPELMNPPKDGDLSKS